jgi:hypothetical protein
MSERSDRFVKRWVQENVHNVPGLDDYRRHVEELVEKLKDDTQQEGIGPTLLAESVGDSYDYLLNEYEQIRDPELGFRD